ncbi:MAG: hypothetical protein WC856_02600 [Methylococcaceae bacterium]
MKQPITQPPIIRYNLKDRQRQFRGQERNFNIKALCDSIMGGATQERIRTRAMTGYFGHKPRILAGMEPTESMVINGKYNEIEPAIVTVSLTCDMDGNIEHQTEFLDTVPGRKAARIFKSRVGGFSSVIDTAKNEFYGLDFVLDPNYSGNRGYALDSANMTYDQVLDEARNEEEEFWLALIATKDAQIEQAAIALDHATTENEQLLSILATRTNCASMELDSTAIKPLNVSLDSANRMNNDAAFFRQTATLPTFVETIKKADAQRQESYETLRDNLGYIR